MCQYHAASVMRNDSLLPSCQCVSLNFSWGVNLLFVHDIVIPAYFPTLLLCKRDTSVKWNAGPPQG